MSPVELYVVAITHLLAWPATRYWMVYRKVKWRAGATGRALFNKARALSLLTLVSITGFWWPYSSYLYVYGVTLTYLTGSVWYQYHIMRKLLAHREDHGGFDPYATPERTDP